MPQDIRPFAATQCDLTQRLLGGATAPSIGYSCVELPTKVGTYPVTDRRGIELKLIVAAVIETDLHK